MNPISFSSSLMRMGHYERVNTELGLVIAGSLKTCSKRSERIKEEEFMASPRKKKHRLTKEQSAFLEGIYLAHNIVTTVNLCVCYVYEYNQTVCVAFCADGIHMYLFLTESEVRACREAGSSAAAS